MCRSLPMNKSPLMLQFGTTTLGFITKLVEDGIEIVRELELDHGKVLGGVPDVFVFNEKIIGICVMRALDLNGIIPQNTSVLVPNDEIDITDLIMRTLDLNRFVHLTLANLLQQDPSDLKCSQVSASCLIKQLEERTLNIDAIDSYSRQIVKLELPSSHLCQRSEAEFTWSHSVYSTTR